MSLATTNNQETTEKIIQENLNNVLRTPSGLMYAYDKNPYDKNSDTVFMVEIPSKNKSFITNNISCLGLAPKRLRPLIQMGLVKYLPKPKNKDHKILELAQDYRIETFIKQNYFKSPAKLHFKYSAMNGGKSTALIQIAYNYTNENKQRVLVAKPSIDSKGDQYVVSRLGAEVKRKCDFLIDETSSIVSQVYEHMADPKKYTNRIEALLIDEAQFLSREDVEELLYISNVMGIAVMCFGLRTDFRGDVFEGSKWLLAYAQDLEELSTRPMSSMGNKNKKATMNIRLVNGKPSFKGEQVAIDNSSTIEYKSVSPRDFLDCRAKSIGLSDYGRDCHNFLKNKLF